MTLRITAITGLLVAIVGLQAGAAAWRLSVSQSPDVVEEAAPQLLLAEILPPLAPAHTARVLGLQSTDVLPEQTTLAGYVAEAIALQEQGVPLAPDVTLPADESRVVLEAANYSIEEKAGESAGQQTRILELVNENNEVIHEEEMKAGEVIIKSPGHSREEVAVAVADAGLEVRKEVAEGVFVVQDPDNAPVEEILAEPAIATLPQAEPNFVVSVAVTPNDTQWANQWGFHNTGQTGGTADADIDAPEAWETATASSSVVVAVIDTGVDYTHPDLAANIWSNIDEIASNGVDDDSNGYIDDVRGWDFYNTDNNPTDDNGHGTHVAGTIGAVGNNSAGVAGVTWGVQLMPLKFLASDGTGFVSDAIEAFDYATNNGATISNNSWGGSGYVQAEYDAINRAKTAGHIVVAAAGNSGTDNDSTPVYPASQTLDNVVAVANSNATDSLSASSNFGVTSVDIAAPGSSIISTLPSNTYGTYSGTSMAAPHIAGALALLKGQNTGWTYMQLVTRLFTSINSLSSLSGKVRTGGRLNLAYLWVAATPTPTPVPQSQSGGDSGGGGGGGGGGEGGGGGGDEAPPKPARKPITYQPEKGHSLPDAPRSIQGSISSLTKSTDFIEKKVAVTKGNYFLELKAAHDRPGPVKVAVYINNKLWKVVALDKNDNKQRAVRIGLLKNLSKATVKFKLHNPTTSTGAGDQQRALQLDWWRLVPD